MERGRSSRDADGDGVADALLGCEWGAAPSKRAHHARQRDCRAPTVPIARTPRTGRVCRLLMVVSFWSLLAISSARLKPRKRIMAIGICPPAAPPLPNPCIRRERRVPTRRLPPRGARPHLTLLDGAAAVDLRTGPGGLKRASSPFPR